MVFFRSFVITGLTLLVAASAALGQVPVRRLADLPGALKSDQSKTEIVHVTTGRPLIVDYDLIRQDFKFLRKLTDNQIDRWLTRQTAIMSLSQLTSRETSTPISHEPLVGRTDDGLPFVSLAVRPQDYGRALVLQVVDTQNHVVGLLDAKGVGAASPANTGHRNGLMAAAEAVREYAYEKLIRKVLKVNGLKTTTVGTYAALDLGFDITERTESGQLVTQRAAMILRQAHARPDRLWMKHPPKGGVRLYMAGAAPSEISAGLEALLRHYGITSAGAFVSSNPSDADVINIQSDRSGRAIVDFGGYASRRRFDRPVFLPEDALWYDMAKDVPWPAVLTPDTAGFVQPAPELRVPYDLWGSTRTGREDSRLDNPWIFAEDIFRNKPPTEIIPREWIKSHVDSMLTKTQIKPVSTLGPRGNATLCRVLLAE